MATDGGISGGRQGAWKGNMFGFILPLVAFYIFVSVFAAGTQEESRMKIFAIGVVATLALSAISHASAAVAALVAALLVAGAISVTGLTLWVRITLLQALKKTGAYLGFIVAYSLAIGFIAGVLAGHPS